MSESVTFLWIGSNDQHVALLGQLGESISAAGGQIVSQQGVELCASFVDAAIAATAAVDLLRQSLGSPGRPLIRLALTGGTAERRSGDDLGRLLERGAALLRAGHPGQILLDDQTRLALGYRLPSGATLRALGKRQLQGFPEAERLHQLLAPGLPLIAPPINTLDQRPQIALQPTPLIGRDQDLEQLIALLRQQGTRLITLSGPAGVGKTRLSFAVAHALVDDFEHGVYGVPLGPISDSLLVLPTIAQRLGLGSSDPLAFLEQLAQRELLIVLDSFERLLPDAPLIEELLLAAPQIKVIVTSRSALKLTMEREWHVQPLGQGDAVQLFVERARALQPEFAMDDANRAIIAEICQRLDRLPLAIELAATRVPQMAPEEILQRMARVLPLLGDDGGPTRQQTLRSAISWSYGLLPPEQQRIFAQLSVFSGSWDAQALTEVLGVSLAQQQPFFDHSLIWAEQRGDQRRFGMYQTIREFAAELLERSPDAAQIRQRHAAFYSRFVQEALEQRDTEAQTRWSARMNFEIANVRSALETLAETRAIAELLNSVRGMTNFWLARGPLAEALRWLQLALDLAGDEELERQLRVYHELSRVLYLQGNYAESRAVLDRAIKLAQRSTTEEPLAMMLNQYGNLALDAGDYTTANSLYRQAAELFVKLQLPIKYGAVLINMAMVAMYQRQFKEAREIIAEVLVVRNEQTHPTGYAFIIGVLGWVEMETGNLDAAIDNYHKALRVYQQLGINISSIYPLWGLATALLKRGEAEQAVRIWASAEATRLQLGVVLAPVDQATHEKFYAAARPALGERYQAIFDSGAAISIEETIKHILSTPAPDATPSGL